MKYVLLALALISTGCAAVQTTVTHTSKYGTIAVTIK